MTVINSCYKLKKSKEGILMEKKIFEIIDSIYGELKEMSRKIHDKPELGFEEFNSCALHEALLEKYGFKVEKEYLGIKTAFKASYSSSKSGPTVAYMAEYDALPGIGHGCGHNILGTVSTGSGIVLKSLIDEIGGTVIVFGTPAEETSGAKVDFVNKGAFDNVDIALMSHPANKYSKSGTSLALNAIRFEYFGKTAHAASCPELGINALDAAINTFNNINALRQQVRSDARIHGIIKEGGKAANIIPDYAVADFYVRATTKTYIDELEERVKNCARGAAQAAGARLEISNYEASYYNMVTNETLSEVFTKNLKAAGCNCVHEPDKNLGSLDAGNVSHVCPTIHPYFAITTDTNVASHSVEFAECAVTDYANEQMRITIAALVQTAIDVIKDEKLLKDIKEEFKNTEK